MSKILHSRWTASLIVTVALVALWSAAIAAESQNDKQDNKAADKTAEDPAVARTRKQVKMLDDLYKTAVVLITKHYVNKDTDMGAGPAAVALFDAMKQKGWHEVRLLDATGEPIEAKNSPQDDFEKTAIKKLKGGESYFEQVVEKNGKRYLRAATPISVVLEKCTMCHDHYRKAKAGEAIGALGYTIPIE